MMWPPAKCERCGFRSLLNEVVEHVRTAHGIQVVANRPSPEERLAEMVAQMLLRKLQQQQEAEPGG